MLKHNSCIDYAYEALGTIDYIRYQVGPSVHRTIAGPSDVTAAVHRSNKYFVALRPSASQTNVERPTKRSRLPFYRLLNCFQET